MINGIIAIFFLFSLFYRAQDNLKKKSMRRDLHILFFIYGGYTNVAKWGTKIIVLSDRAERVLTSDWKLSTVVFLEAVE